MQDARVVGRWVVLAVLVVGLVACGSPRAQIPAVSGDMDCAEVAAIVEGAIERGTQYVGLQESDAQLSSELVFALSGAEERPECVTDAVRSRAAGLRATLVGTSG